MLYEVRAAKPHDGGLRQRWYTDDDFDLTVWFSTANELRGFQLCYDKRGAGQETAFTWHPGRNAVLNYVDEGHRASTPILVPGGRAPDAALLAKFRLHAKNLEAPLMRLVIEELQAHMRRAKLQPRGKV